METKTIHTPVTLKSDSTGELSAVFSTFSRNGSPVIDRDNDVTLPSAFTNGQPIALTWGHDWQKIIGAGKVRVEPDRAVFDGKLFLNTQLGRDCYETLKELGTLAEYSWGFKILKSDYQTIGTKRIRRILAAEVMEVAAVLKGAAGTGNSHTLSIKHANAHDADQLLDDNLLLQARIMGIEPWPASSTQVAELAAMARRLGVGV